MPESKRRVILRRLKRVRDRISGDGTYLMNLSKLYDKHGYTEMAILAEIASSLLGKVYFIVGVLIRRMES